MKTALLFGLFVATFMAIPSAEAASQADLAKVGKVVLDIGNKVKALANGLADAVAKLSGQVGGAVAWVLNELAKLAQWAGAQSGTAAQGAHVAGDLRAFAQLASAKSSSLGNNLSTLIRAAVQTIEKALRG